ncbi:eCIS core domain-containing protein [Paraburkholderia fungorum]|uniref:eCIS core domain-containing protein n=1 Tax=Paraburkholderia fungorum TaxID=134537 RepID=UPI0038BC5170
MAPSSHPSQHMTHGRDEQLQPVPDTVRHTRAIPLSDFSKIPVHPSHRTGESQMQSASDHFFDSREYVSDGKNNVGKQAPLAGLSRTESFDIPDLVHEALRSPGLPLDSAVRRFFEPRFGHDFSRVRVHADENARESAAAVHAHAYTVGSHIVLGHSGKTSAIENQPLLAHELAHVTQDASSATPDIGSMHIEPPSGEREVSARGAANAVLSGHTPAIMQTASPVPLLFRQEIDAPDLEVVPPDAKIRLPSASTHGADPRNNGDYIDRNVTEVAYGIYVGGFLIFCKGVPQPFLVPERLVDFGTQNYESVSAEIYADQPAALQALPIGPWQPRQALPYTFFRAPKSPIIAPTVFSPNTAPRIVETARDAVSKLKDHVQTELTKMAISLAGQLLTQVVIAGLSKVGKLKSGTNSKANVTGNDTPPPSSARGAGKEPPTPPTSAEPPQLPARGESTRTEPGFDRTREWRNPSAKDGENLAGLDHLSEEHAPWSRTSPNKSKFTQDAWNDLKALIKETVKQGQSTKFKPSEGGPQSGSTYDYRFQNRQTGLDGKGKPLFGMRVVVDANNQIVTAFPIK